MATGMFGANVEELVALAGRFDHWAGVAEEAGSALAGEIEGVEWMGPDAAAFKADATERIRTGLDALADLQFDRTDHLRQQADDQEEASKPGGDKGCLEQTGDFLGGLVKGIFVDGIWGDITGIVDIFTDFPGFVTGIAGLAGIDLTGNNRSWWDTFSSSWGSVIGDFFAADLWATDPGRALGKVAWNIGSMFIPGYNVAKVLKMLRRVDVPDVPNPSRVDAPNPSRADTPNTDKPDADPPSRTPDGGDAQTLPPGAERLPDGSVRAPDGRVFDADHQVNNVDTLRQTGTTDPRINRDPTDASSTFKPDSMYTTSDGQTFITNERGLVEYSSISRTYDELPGSRAELPDPPARDYAHYDNLDERGHHNPDFMGGTNDNINLTEQSAGANRGAHPDGAAGNHQPGSVHQHLLETRTQQYMQAHPTERVTWERRTMYDPNGHAVGYQVRVTGENGPVDLSRMQSGGGYRADAAPGPDGWVTIVD